ncbi:peptidoglycan/LPS O-acetylase OafA/YrhL [Arthrobacter sp. PvP102]|uniref:acyltransferase family protein n=1 Tax=unclassified Arthrobacter TaxID=235627 RepID=UPI001AE975C5|nr:MULTISPECIES: acyltransferase [unclassified Arthrobacter]MBP1232498.1 peptidoglycan/LPS O-acetylase OafA/YrhL [Arthrobacter sp. PvP103]MBP1237633.1 peptidoglycan/LPS O-acetylase OafA/YrhL [Arthrobacter sp. PvP102]
MDTRHNSLNFLRLVLAALVIVSHASPIGGFGEPLRFGGIQLGTLAVGGFFGISGYLITRSGFSSALLPYLWRRFLRIFPGYWGCLAAVGLGFAAIAGVTRGGWSLGIGVDYFLSNVTMVFSADLLHGTLAGAPFPATWNGSLWTLRYELCCYVAVGLALLIPQVRRMRVILPLAFAAVSALSVYVQFSGGPLIVRDMALLVPFFLAGATLYRFSHRIPITGICASGAAVFLLIVMSFDYGKSLAALPVAYLCLWLGIALPSVFRRVGARNDVSYGMYLYGFPVQQMLALAGAHHLGLPAFMVLGILATVPLAVASWILIERPAMNLKDLPARVRSKVSVRA